MGAPLLGQGDNAKQREEKTSREEVLASIVSAARVEKASSDKHWRAACAAKAKADREWETMCDAKSASDGRLPHVVIMSIYGN